MKANPHRRWFLTYYRLPPNDPRYLALTDPEIVFDMLTVVDVDEEASADGLGLFETRDAPSVPTPPTVGKDGLIWRKEGMTVAADRDEFRRWFEEKIGPWPL